MTQRGPALRAADRPLVAAVADPVALLAAPSTRLLKRGMAGRTVGLVRCGGREVIVKLFDESAPRHRLVRLFTGSAAARAAAGAAAMRDAGLPAPPVVAVFETAMLCARPASCVVTEFVDGQRGDHLWDESRARPRLRRRLVAALAERVRAIHDRGLYPQDVGMVNWVAAPVDRGWDLVLVDLDRVRRYARVSRRRRRKNLVQLELSFGRTASQREKLLFLRRYLGRPDAAELRRTAAEVARDAGEKERRRRPAADGVDRGEDLL